MFDPREVTSVVQSVWSSVATGWNRALAAAGEAPLEVMLVGVALAACALLLACALGLRRVARELLEGRAELGRALLALRELEEPVGDAAGALQRIRERVEATLPPDIHVDSIVAQQLEIRAGAGANGSGRRSNPNLIVHDFD